MGFMYIFCFYLFMFMCTESLIVSKISEFFDFWGVNNNIMNYYNVLFREFD